MTVTKSRRGLFLLSLLFKKQRNLPQKLPDFPHMSCWPGLVIHSLSIVMGPEPTRSCCRGWHWGTREDRDLGTIGSVSSEEVGGPSGGLLTVCLRSSKFSRDKTMLSGKRVCTSQEMGRQVRGKGRHSHSVPGALVSVTKFLNASSPA